jgi:hypothetical protein
MSHNIYFTYIMHHVHCSLRINPKLPRTILRHIGEGGDGEEWQRHNNKSLEYLFMMETILQFDWKGKSHLL